jgi:hypothetical protein
MGFYILPRAENKSSGRIYKRWGKDTCKATRIKSNARNNIGVYKRSQHTPSGTRGLLSLEDLDEQLSTIVPRVPHMEDEMAICIF